MLLSSWVESDVGTDMQGSSGASIDFLPATRTRKTSVVTSVTCISENISSDEALAIEKSPMKYSLFYQPGAVRRSLPTCLHLMKRQDRATKISPRTKFSVASVAIQETAKLGNHKIPHL